MKKILLFLISFLTLWRAASVFASSHWTIQSLTQKVVTDIINPLIAVLMILGTAVFLWGIIEFLANPDNEQKRTQGKKHMLWGIVGLFIMVSAWGIIAVLCDFFETCEIIGGGEGDLTTTPTPTPTPTPPKFDPGLLPNL